MKKWVIIFYLFLCVSHKLELAIHNAFKASDLKTKAEEQQKSCHYFSKPANLK